MDIVHKLKSTWPLKGGVTVDDQWDHHNRGFMFILLAIFGMIVTVRQYTGKVISCTGFLKIERDFAEDYCWTQGLYTIREAYDKPRSQVPYPGVVPEDVPACLERRLVAGGRVRCPDPQEVQPPTRVYHLWYQWVPFYFFLSATMFYMPYMIQKQMGFRNITPVVRLLHNPMETYDELQKTIDKAVTWLYFKLNVYYTKHTLVAKIFQKHWLGILVIIVKLLYLGISVAIFYLTSKMFAIGDFLFYGYDFALAFYRSDTDATRVRHRIFPKMVACEVARWGTTGLETEKGMCVLAPNVINQYLFLILWFSYVIVMLSNIISVLYAVIKLPLVKAGYWRFLHKSFVQDDPNIRKMYLNIGMSGRLILHILATNVPPKIFERVVKDLSQQIVLSGHLVGEDDLEACDESHPVLRPHHLPAPSITTIMDGDKSEAQSVAALSVVQEEDEEEGQNEGERNPSESNPSRLRHLLQRPWSRPAFSTTSEPPRWLLRDIVNTGGLPIPRYRGQNRV